ncbi:MAG: VOC family protein [Lachnospiraceae bacterium]|nr:VOC family protein [Lachnospiraceae bacterium]
MKVHHVGYLVKSIDDSREQFLQLGFTAETEKEYDGIRDIFIQFFLNGDYRVELVSPASDGSRFFPALKRFKNLPYHICYETDNMEESIRELSDRGFALSQTPENAPCINNKRVAFLQCPEMGIIELLEV